MHTLRVGLIDGSGQEENFALKYNTSGLVLEYNYPDSNSFTSLGEHGVINMYGWLPLIVHVLVQAEFAVDNYYFAYDNGYSYLNSRPTDYGLQITYYNNTLYVDLDNVEQGEYITEVRVYNCVYPVSGTSILTTQNKTSVYQQSNTCFYGPGEISSTANSKTLNMAVPVYSSTIPSTTTLTLNDSQLTVSPIPSTCVLGTYTSQNGNPDYLSNGSSSILTSNGSILTSDGIYTANNKLLWNKNNYALMVLINSSNKAVLSYSSSTGKWSSDNNINEGITGGEYSNTGYRDAIYALTWGQWAYWNGTSLDWKH